jgi:peptidoglycan hydrolase-like protein with peptidoglycan-binding domain
MNNRPSPPWILLAAGRALALAWLGLTGAGCLHAPHAPQPAEVPATKPDHERAAETRIPVASTPQGLMREGAEKKIQERLRDKGLLAATQISGQLDPDTRAALRTFQKKEGLPTTGLPSYETVDRLGLDLDAIFHRHVPH